LFPYWQVASGGNGATTVSATMFFAHKVRTLKNFHYACLVNLRLSNINSMLIPFS
jgi:hypothetical protein